MNRMEEYQAMMKVLDQPAPALDATLDRAYKRKRKKTRQMILRPAAGLAACFAAFVLLVNFCAPVAYACSQVAVLRELAAAVTFSRSLSDAVENAYVQPMALSQTENEITAEVAYLIVDQKQVNVFFRIQSDKYSELAVDPIVVNPDDSGVSCSWSTNGLYAENGELRCFSIDFVDENVPDSLKVKFNVYSSGIREETFAPENAVDDIFEDDPDDERNYLAKFAFLLEFDPKFTAVGKVIPVDKTVILDGQAITITDIEVYPTHLRVDIAESESNTAWLKDLDFYIQTDWGMKFDPVSSGITATGSADSPSLVSYRADSTYFYEAEHLRVVITGATWLRKDMEKIYINLVTGETGTLPEGAAYDSSRRSGNGWVVRFRADWSEDEPMYQVFRNAFCDADGNEYEINMWSSSFGEANEDGRIDHFYEEFPLKNYPYDEVWLCPYYSHYWTAENTIHITVQ